MSDEDSNRLVAGLGSVGGIILLLVFVFFFLYCRKRRKLRNRPSHSTELTTPIDDCVYSSSSVHSLGYINDALQCSDQDTERELQKENKQELAGTEAIFFTISIKLLMSWNPMYSDGTSVEYEELKGFIEESIADIYLNYPRFQRASVQEFRKGSVIADIQLEFFSNAKHPLIIIKEAVKFGRFSNLEVDKKYFFEKRTQLSCSPIRSSRAPVHITRPCQNSIHDCFESGYGSQNFEPGINLSASKKDASQRSVILHGSVASGASLSMKSTTTNPSIHNVADVSIEKHERSIRVKEALKTLVKLDKKRAEESNIGVPHLGLFNFDPQDHRELSLRQGQLIYVTYVDNAGWAKATNETGNNGWVPQNFIVPVDLQQYANTKKAVESIVFLDNVIKSLDSPNDPLRPDFSPEELSIVSSQQHNNVPLHDIQSSMFITIFPFEPSERNELKLELGDLVDVLKTSETGWWKGTCLRTQVDGWFPSSYVKPQPSHLSMNDYLLNSQNDKGYLSDSELHKQAAFSHKQKYSNTSGYSSDNGAISQKGRSKIVGADTHSECSDNNCMLCVAAHSKGSVVSLSRSLPSERTSKQVDAEGSRDFVGEPPSKPVPPKPRKRHIQDKLRSLASQSGSLNSLVTRSSENLAYFDKMQQMRKRCSSEGVSGMTRRPINKLRPRSQDQPQKNFFDLANRYASLTPACSLPSLAVKQVKISPDDERPFLEPIPRKTKRNSLPDIQLTKKEEIYSPDVIKTRSLKVKSTVFSAPVNVDYQSDCRTDAFKVEQPLSAESQTCQHENDDVKGSNEKTFQSKKSPPLNDRSHHSRPVHRPFSSMESTILEESENFPPDDDLQRRVGSSVRDAEIKKHKPNTNLETSLSRAESFQSLTSFASSCRSNASSKHEQMNLRRAVVDVKARGDDHLSFDVGAILYELRPKNKQGLSFGILEDSTQGWYPSASVEAFYDTCVPFENERGRENNTRIF